jgi:phytoene dehydrogenase-like protein
MPTPHAIVIGAGINGLVAAFYLRRAGYSVTLLERATRVGGACISAEATVEGKVQRYALGASVLGLMPDFIFRETGLADRLATYVPEHPKRVHFPDHRASAWIHRDRAELDRELGAVWGERGEVTGFRVDEERVVSYLRDGYRTATPPNVESATARLGPELTRLWITGSAARLLDHYFTAERTKIYMGMTVTESGPVSLHEPYSAFTIPLMDSGSVFDGYYGFVQGGLWRLTEELGSICQEVGVAIRLGSPVEGIDPERGEVRFDGGSERCDHVVLATDPLTAARLLGDPATLATVEGKRFLGTSGKLTLFFREPVRWKEDPEGRRDTTFRFIFAVDTLAEFEAATLRVLDGGLDYQPGYIQIYCEGAAMRQLGLGEPFDRLTCFFKNVRLGSRGADLPDVAHAVKAQVLEKVANPEACAWHRLLAPADLRELFLFPGGNLDHTMLVGGQTFADRRFPLDPDRGFYQFGRWPTISYCGAGAYPCGSIAGTPGYMCAREIANPGGLSRTEPA